ncbi:uncharacterized protein [Dendropsophus ebraccatus]|uniref:uncharacterized protein isoform X2 n=1 Tax=Dendropsophus ebraccatus TaxID=150705 RepID=UPI003831D176
MKHKMNYLLFGIILIMMALQCQSGEYITQDPALMDRVEGKSAEVKCYYSHIIDIRKFTLEKARNTILQLYLKEDMSHVLSLSGTFENLKCGFKDGSTCKVTTDADTLDVPKDDPCPPTKHSSQKILYRGNETFASIWIDPGYRSRIDISVNIKNFTYTLQQLTVDDSGSFFCSGCAIGGIGILNKHSSTRLSVTKGPDPKSWIRVLSSAAAFVVVIIVSVIIYCRCKKKNPSLAGCGAHAHFITSLDVEEEGAPGAGNNLMMTDMNI